MPRALQFLLLVLAVPLQYLICQWTAPSAGERAQLIKQFSKSFTLFGGGILEWQKWPEVIANWTRSMLLFLDVEDGECPAEEVIKFVEKNGHFGMSTVPRSPRPKHIKFKVGQVIRHKLWNYRGVIIGWDEKMKASELWAQNNHGDKKHWRDMPNYAILVDIRDRPSSQITYVPEENIELLTNTKVVHQTLEEYFVEFDGARYLPRPWLKKVYPHG
ncbi:F-box only protein 21-like [Porites lutea]|uniref:F-box only protein 21-like n=1 Tax=Porites lutea TaxID=51062 RepID=UPI003CC59AE0